MRIGVLETGKLADALAGAHSPYEQMFRRLLHSADPTVELFNVPVVEGVLPGSPTDADGWIITGSRHGAYEDLHWIPPFEGFLRDVYAANVPILGICFGHQILAKALGGTVVKSDKGWGAGVHHYTPLLAPAWMEGFEAGFAGLAMHQDQVTVLPEGTTVLAASEFCPHAVVAYGDPEDPLALTLQPHPEFDAGFVRDVIHLRSGSTMPTEVGDAGLKSLSEPVDNDLWAKWMVAFLRRASERRAKVA